MFDFCKGFVYTGFIFHKGLRDLPYCKLNVMFRCKCRLTPCFNLKIHFGKKVLSEIIYCDKCSKFKFTYYGK